ncbi:MAG: hypothetical protein L0H64_11915 [Pseudonocardia sp.]|nr:hypothetical protein [Pseudonocardia sp.]
MRPLEALVPGVQGKVLATCLRSDEPLTMRALRRVADRWIVTLQLWRERASASSSRSGVPTQGGRRACRHPLVLAADETTDVDGELWDSIRRDAIAIAGADPRAVLRAA